MYSQALVLHNRRDKLAFNSIDKQGNASAKGGNMGNYSNTARHDACGVEAGRRTRALIGRIARAAFSVAAIGVLVAHGPAARAQGQEPDDLISPWLVTVQGEARTRTLKVNGVTAKPDGTYVLDAVYGWSNGAAAAIKAEVSQTPAGRKLTLTTQANSVISATQSADGSFSGTFTDVNGNSKPVKLVMVSESAPASAAAASTFLKKDELEKLVIGKDVLLSSKRTGSEIVWGIKPDGNLYGFNQTSKSSDSAEWKIRDDGALCIQWRGNSNNGCVFFNRQGDRYTLHSSKKKPATFEVISIK
jgi:hypothetical protein